MKILNQHENTIGEYKKVYIVDVIDKFNRKWSRIDGVLMNSSEKIPLGKYRDHEQALQVLNLLMNEPEVYIMPLETFEESDDFLYPMKD